MIRGTIRRKLSEEVSMETELKFYRLLAVLVLLYDSGEYSI
jgi:hypothetical protein